jgi:UDP-3-O-[3-hydroxymyristoyl] glucosamine N-acyltransferase
MTVREIAALLGNAPFEGDADREIQGAAPLEEAGEHDISFVSNRKSAASAVSSRAGALVVSNDFVNEGGTPLIRVPDPRASMARITERLYPKRVATEGVHPTAIIASGAIVESGAAIGPYAIIGAGANIGEGTRIGAGCSIGEQVRIGAHSTLHSHVTIYDNCTIGERAVLHSGCVIGADGFGFVLREGAWANFPQVGRVEIGDDVEIGANACVDRAALGVTRIGSGSKLDNMVHIGHNCHIGCHVVIAAQTGLAGGVTIEDYAIIGGQVGIGDKARIESRAILGSGAGVLTSKIVRGGQVMWGTPARPLKQHLAQLAALARLPEVLKEWESLRKRLG